MGGFVVGNSAPGVGGLAPGVGGSVKSAAAFRNTGRRKPRTEAAPELGINPQVGVDITTNQLAYLFVDTTIINMPLFSSVNFFRN